MWRRRSRRDPSKVGGLLRGVLPRQAEERLALPELRKVWAEIVGGALAAKTYAEDIDEGALLVKAESPAAAKMISMRAGSLARELSRRTGISVTSVKVVPGKASHRPSPSRKEEPFRVVPPKELVERNFEEVKEKFSPERETLARRFASLMALFQKRFPGK